MLYSLSAVLGVCCTRCKLYSVYAVLDVYAGSWVWEIERDDLFSCSYVMAELRMRKNETKGYWGNDHQKLGFKRMSCSSRLTIPNTAGMIPDPGCHSIQTRSSQLNQASRTPDISYPLISTLCWSSSLISRCLIHHSTIIAKHRVRSSLSISRCHDH